MVVPRSLVLLIFNPYGVTLDMYTVYLNQGTLDTNQPTLERVIKRGLPEILDLHFGHGDFPPAMFDTHFFSALLNHYINPWTKCFLPLLTTCERILNNY